MTNTLTTSTSSAASAENSPALTQTAVRTDNVTPGSVQAEYVTLAQGWAARWRGEGTSGTLPTPRPTERSGTTSAAPQPTRLVPTTGGLPILGMHKWAGSILSIEDGLLTAELFPLDHEGPSLVADFDLDLLAPDESAAKPGDVVYLTTRLIQGRWGHKEATTHLRLRRPGRWTESEVDDIYRRAADKARILARYAD